MIANLERMHAATVEAKNLAKALEEAEDDIAQQVFETMLELEIEYTKGKSLSVRVSEETVPKVEDWPKLYAYIVETGEFDLLQRRPGVKAFNDRWDDGGRIPGVEPLLLKKLRVRSL